MKPSRLAWAQNRWPLIELEMTRHDCLRWMQAHGYPTPPRSACTYCPFHSDVEWRKLKKDSPEDFAAAVTFEKQLQDLLTGIGKQFIVYENAKPIALKTIMSNAIPF